MAIKRTVSPEKIQTIIGPDTVITGTLQGSGPVRIDGKVEGEINVESDIIVGAGASVQAKIKGNNIQVAGKVVGNIEATGKLEILASGVVEGDVITYSLQIEDGAALMGTCSMRRTPQVD
jgi:cytoskeletal protein CcmA (bactofilin family)